MTRWLTPCRTLLGGLLVVCLCGISQAASAGLTKPDIDAKSTQAANVQTVAELLRLDNERALAQARRDTVRGSGAVLERAGTGPLPWPTGVLPGWPGPAAPTAPSNALSPSAALPPEIPSALRVESVFGSADRLRAHLRLHGQRVSDVGVGDAAAGYVVDAIDEQGCVRLRKADSEPSGEAGTVRGTQPVSTRRPAAALSNPPGSLPSSGSTHGMVTRLTACWGTPSPRGGTAPTLTGATFASPVSVSPPSTRGVQ